MQYGVVCSVKWWVCVAYTTLYILHRAIVMLQTGGQKVLIVGNITFFTFSEIKKNNKNMELSYKKKSHALIEGAHFKSK